MNTHLGRAPVKLHHLTVAMLVALGLTGTATSGLQAAPSATHGAGTSDSATTLANMSAESARQLVKDAYIYGYPLVLMDITRQQATHASDATSVPGRAPVNQFAHFRAYPKADAKDVVRFNFDTLYSLAWLDLSNGPIILSVPDTHGRYYLVPSLDMWTDVFSSLGSRTTGTGAGNFAYVAPGWSGTLPKGVTKIVAPTSIIWVMGRTQTNGPADYDNVHKIQDGLKLTPLASWGKPYASPSKVPLEPNVDDKTPPLVQLQNMNGLEFFKRMSDLLAKYPPHPNDYPILLRIRALGIEPGQPWDSSRFDANTTALINEASKEALGDVVAFLKRGGEGTHVNGWNIATDNMGTYGTSYLQRALVALAGLGANLPADAVYPAAFVDSTGQPLDGSHKYVMHFTKEQVPPANAFWSLTMYDGQGFQVPNPINRFAIGDRDKLKFNADGSLDIYIQHDSPGVDKESNWLPSPAVGELQPTLRVYSPKASVMNGTWVPPGIKRVG